MRVERSLTHGVSRSIYREQIKKLIHLLTEVLVVAHYPAAVGSNLLRDPDDEPILATALAAGADMVVSWNTRDFPPARVAAGVRFLTPVEFLAVLEARHPRERLGEQIRDAGRQLP